LAVDLAALRARLPSSPRTRFAPSPTGWLHLGHIVNAIYVWGIARALDGRVVLRIEDHDRERSRAAYEEGILEDLMWLGLTPDEGSSEKLIRQSDRQAAYEKALDRLDHLGLVYACRCSRREIGQAGGKGSELRYPGTCRDREWPRDATAGLRIRIDAGEEPFDDGAHGPQIQSPADQSGDVLIRDRLGQWTYQWAVTVDDMDHGIDLVIRGEDLVASTGRQIRIARLLGRRDPAVFLHHPLLYGAAGVKLSKSNRDAGIREMRRGGLSPADVLGLAAARAGLMSEARSVPADDLQTLFE